jgi:hypothetical protein
MIRRRALAGDFAGNSLRSGFATEAYAQGTPELAVMRHGCWRSAAVMRGYVEEGASGPTTPPQGWGPRRSTAR